jgi:hypothetical protein
MSKRSSQISGQWGFHCPAGHVDTFNIESPQWWGSCGALSPSDSVKNHLLSKLLEKVKGHSFNAGVSASQVHLTANMVVGTLGKLGRSFMALRHGDFATAARQLGVSPRTTRLKPSDVAGRWLELQYGWKPALADVYSAAKAMESISEGPSKTRFSVRSNESTTRVFKTVTFLGDSTTAHCDFSRSYTFEAYEEMGFARQLGLLDPLSVAWEVLPYSFVVDWFLPIGQYLSNLNQIPHLVGRWLVTDLTTWQVYGTDWLGAPLLFCNVHSNRRYTGLAFKPSVKYTEVHVVRNSSASPPKVNLPSIKLAGAVHGTRVGNAISLAYQRFMR